MVVYDNRLDFITTVHSMTHLNLSAVLENTSQSEFLVMCAVRRLCIEQNGNTFGISDIAESLHVSSPAISRTISTLEKKGFVELLPDPADKRKQRIVLTKSCQDFCEKNNDMSITIMAKMFEGISEKDIKTTIKTITKIESNLSEV